MSPEHRPPVDFEPATMPTSSLTMTRAVWFKRPWFLATAGIAILVLASILVDLPGPVSNAEDITSQNASIKQINQDLAGCGYAVQETFTIYNEFETGTLTAYDRKYASKMLADDQTACSFTSSAIFDLTNNIQVQDTAAGKYVDRMLSTVTIWATSDALAAIEDIQALYLNPQATARSQDLSKKSSLLAKDRQQAIEDILNADRILHASLTPPSLPALPQF